MDHRYEPLVCLIIPMSVVLGKIARRDSGSPWNSPIFSAAFGAKQLQGLLWIRLLEINNREENIHANNFEGLSVPHKT